MQALAFSLAMGLAASGITSASVESPAASARPSAMPAHFVPNLGQYPERARFVCTYSSWTLTVADNGLIVHASEPAGPDVAITRAVTISTVPNDMFELLSSDRQTHEIDYYLGTDPAAWRRGVPTFGQVTMRSRVSGVSLVIHAFPDGPEIDIDVPPERVADELPLWVDGADAIESVDDGFAVRTGALAFRLSHPIAMAIGRDGARRPLSCRSRAVDSRTITTSTSGLRTGESLLIDPVITFGTYIDGSADDYVTDVAIAPSGEIVVAGHMNSFNFPGAPGQWHSNPQGLVDAFVLRMTPDGTAVVRTTVFGGFAEELAFALDVLPDGSAVIGGYTTGGIPTTPNAFDSTYSGSPFPDAYVAAIDASGGLVYSTYLGSPWPDLCLALDHLSNGDIIAGGHCGPGFPSTPGAPYSTGSGFLVRLNPSSGQLVFASGFGAGKVFGLTVHQDRIYAIGWTSGEVFSATGISVISGFGPILSDGSDSKMALSVDSGGTIYALTVGTAVPPDPFAYDTSLGGIRDLIVAKYSQGSLIRATFLGGSNLEFACDLDATYGGNPYVIGYTGSLDFPKSDAIPGVPTSGFAVAKLNSELTSLSFASIVADAGGTLGFAGAPLAGIEVTSSGAAVFAGSTDGSAITTPGTIDPTGIQYQAGFVCRVELPIDPGFFLPGLGGCVGSGGIVPLINGTGFPMPGNQVSIAISKVTGNAVGILLFGFGPGSQPLNPMCAVNVLPLIPFSIPVFVPGIGAGGGAISMPSVIPNNTPPGDIWLQAFFNDAGAPLGVSGTNRLRVHVGSWQ